MARQHAKSPLNFKPVPQDDVPHGRNGKHKTIVTKILADLSQIEEGEALKVPLAHLEEGKVNVRSALNRASRRNGLQVATASDEAYLYLWNKSRKDPGVN